MKKIVLNLNDNGISKQSTTPIYQGENKATQLVINLMENLSAYKYLLRLQNNTGTEYPTEELTPVNRQVTYLIPNSVLTQAGYLNIEINAYETLSQTEKRVIKSGKVSYQVLASMNIGDTPIPETFVPWYTQASEKAGIATTQAGIATTKANEALASKEAAELSEAYAENYKIDALASKNAAKSSEDIVKNLHTDIVNNYDTSALAPIVAQHTSSLAQKVNQIDFNAKFGSIAGMFTFKGSDTWSNISAKTGMIANDCWYDTTNSRYVAYNGTVWVVDIGNINLGNGSVTKQKLASNAIELNGLGNIYETSMVINGYYINSSGSIVSSTTSSYAKIPIAADNNHCIWRNGNNNWTTGYGYLLFLDASNNILTMVDMSTLTSGAYNGYNYKIVIPPNNAVFMAINTKVGALFDYTNTMIVVKGSELSDAVLNSKRVVKLFDIPIASESTNVQPKIYSGKKWVCIGDSLTEVNSRTTLHYHDYIAEELGMSVVNMGVGGTGYKRLDDVSKAFYQRILNTPTDADIVTIFGSGNDLGGGTTLGNITDTGTSTLCGAINTTIDNFYSICPVIPIGIITPSPWVGYPTTSSGNAMELYSNAIVDICKRRGIPCLDLYHTSNLRPWDATFRTLAYSKDAGNGVHPDEVGHKIIASKIKEFIKTLM